MAKSPPSAFTVVVDPTASEGAGFALAQPFPAATVSTTLAFDLRVDDLRTGDAGVTITLARVTFASSYVLELVLRSDGAVLVERSASGVAVEHPLNAKLGAMTWSRVQVDVFAAGTVGLRLDGADALERHFPAPAARMARSRSTSELLPPPERTLREPCTSTTSWSTSTRPR